ncbi:MAG: helix-turn-helix domain-containing protein, partial [Deltaproteobacteria bacterium]|nr:helix-turn-helix domain-containing protein [Deltaproteobacteria bacterium]
MEKSENIRIQSLGRAFSILELFAADNAPLGVTAISERVGLHKSTCFGLISTLEHLGYLLQDKNSGKYSL